MALFMYASFAEQSAAPAQAHLGNADVLRGWVTNSNGERLRTYVTRPKSATGKVPVIFFVGWLSCDSMEYANGETDGFGAAVTSGAVLAFGEAVGTAVGEGLVPPSDHGILVVVERHDSEFAKAVSMLATVRTSPPLKLPSVLFAGNVAVGAWPTGIGSYVSPTTGLISLPPK